MLGTELFFGCICCHFWALMGPLMVGMVDMPISDRFEISLSKEMVNGIIFGVEYLILTTKTKMLGKQLFFGCMCGHFGALMGPLMVGNCRYANPR